MSSHRSLVDHRSSFLCHPSDVPECSQSENELLHLSGRFLLRRIVVTSRSRHLDELYLLHRREPQLRDTSVEHQSVVHLLDIQPGKSKAKKNDQIVLFVVAEGKGNERKQTFIARWCSDQLGHFVFLLIFAHVDANETTRLILFPVEIFGDLFG